MVLDPTAVAAMIFSLLCLVVIVGGILMFPLMKRLGQLMDQRLAERREGVAVDGGREPAGGEFAELLSAVESLEQQVNALSERQRFMEGLLDSSEERASLPERGEA